MVKPSCLGAEETLTEPIKVELDYWDSSGERMELPLIFCKYQGVHPGEVSRCTAGGVEPYPTCSFHRAYE